MQRMRYPLEPIQRHLADSKITTLDLGVFLFHTLHGHMHNRMNQTGVGTETVQYASGNTVPTSTMCCDQFRQHSWRKVNIPPPFTKTYWTTTTHTPLLQRFPARLRFGISESNWQERRRTSSRLYDGQLHNDHCTGYTEPPDRHDPSAFQY